MLPMKRICIYTCIILLIMSLYNDFTKDSHSDGDNNFHNHTTIINELPVVKIKVTNGETVLSVSERVNDDNLTNISIQEIIADFKSVNPHVHTHQLSNNTYYYFPIYD